MDARRKAELAFFAVVFLVAAGMLFRYEGTRTTVNNIERGDISPKFRKAIRGPRGRRGLQGPPGRPGVTRRVVVIRRVFVRVPGPTRTVTVVRRLPSVKPRATPPAPVPPRRAPPGRRPSPQLVPTLPGGLPGAGPGLLPNGKPCPVRNPRC